MNSSTFNTDRHGWAELLSPRQATQPFQGNHRAPWAVIGAGFTGLAAARRLAEIWPDQEIYLLDAREVGQGASGRNSGFAVAISHFGSGLSKEEIRDYRRVNRINQAGLALLRDRVQSDALACQWREQGFYHAAADEKARKECAHFQRYLDALEIEHSPLDASDLAARLGTETYQMGIHVAQGALVQPAALVRALAETLPANVHLFENSPVERLDHGAPHRLVTSKGVLEADKVLLATNFEAPKLGFLNGRISATTLSGSFTRVLTDEERKSLGSVSDWGVLSLHGGGATVRLTVDGRISLRNVAEYHGGHLLSDEQLKERQTTHRASFERRFPQLAHVPFEFAWSGVEGISRNGTNFFGEFASNLYLAGGYNGSGVSRGTAFGHALADFASGTESDLASDCLASKPASWIPPRPLLDIGAYFTIRQRFKGVGLDR
ncbi:MAG: FAD-binding oxidoreductase [Roseibium sp.]|uniref:NAD(P)/FAD-dependent oxidoreductase n=1 Tax=Roseibium sp. TaxID=1936156 RepID=UPI001B023FB2|nr:FAD-binding oxidoreductase [Roseibium sp.]MBO6894927.1 FAD-binding oxidoreductase [Roseibium sp.]MBO6930817.1 FAD-binding oxidoreductase [Roseibium sp.]